MSYLNAPLLRYVNEIRSAVLIVHGEKAHSRYMGADAYKAMMDGNPVPGNKELLIVPGAKHTDLYDDVGKIPFGKFESFLREHMGKKEG